MAGDSNVAVALQPKRWKVPLAALFARQHGVATLAQLIATGLSRQEVRTLVAEGHLRRIHRGVYTAGWLPLSEPARFIAASLRTGRAPVSCDAAGVLHSFLERAGGPVDVTTPTWRAAPPGIVVHTRRLPRDEITIRLGIPVTSAERTLLDLAATKMPERRLRRALHEAEVQRATTHAKTSAFLADHAGTPGAPRLRRLLDLGPAPTRSELEDDLHALIHDLEPVTNATVHGEEVDAYFPEANLVIEADGDRFHATPERRRRDAEKQARLEAHGCQVMRFTPYDVNDAPQRTRTRVLRALAG